ncbi:phosphoesterase family-domain-containing protein [Irpex rosettiformis]|uniref:Phosphoesterase family-domain-containing protein n=1 Tax=Irpex rosettiformis TaxID=378272 RepID=A0ACB8U025_9APHY|nr:phosphoesterase family-domain-containing protein [Irpex rosettiformis]
MFPKSLFALVPLVPTVLGAVASPFAPAALTPLSSSTNYTGQSNGTLAKANVVPGKVFDRFIQIWLENTNYEDAASTKTFQSLKEQGIQLSQYHAVTHPSEPNYAAAAGGDFWALADDNYYNIPANVSTVVDLLESKNISWASYQENLPTDGFEGFNFSSTNYLNASAPAYTYYVRKHNPTILYDSVASVPSRLARHRNFNNLAADINASVIPQWVFITPNMVNDGHDTSVDFIASWLDYFLPTLLNNTAFNDNRTLILLTFDENENYAVQNRIFTLLLGGAVPSHLKNTTDDTFYTHFSTLSTVQSNWGLPSLGRQDANATVSNVFSLVANVTGYTNNNLTGSSNASIDAFPLTNLTGVYAGPLNAQKYVPFLAPELSAKGAGNGSVFVAASGVNLNLNLTSAPRPVNLTALNQTVPAAGPRANGTDSGSSGSSSNSSGGSSGGKSSERFLEFGVDGLVEWFVGVGVVAQHIVQIN